MKVENGGMNRVTQKRVDGTHPSGREQQLGDQGKLDGLSGKDEALLSDRARLLATSRASLNEVPDVRTDLVDGLRKEVEAGTYKVPIEALAKKLVSQLQLE
jgi:negative regulator of flagellin synthesis FlgM